MQHVEAIKRLWDTLGICGIWLPRRAPAQAASADPEVTQKVYFDVSVGGQPPERLVLGLYGKDVPKTGISADVIRCHAFLSHLMACFKFFILLRRVEI